MKNIIFSTLIIFCASCATAPANAPSFQQADIGKPNEDLAVLILYRQIVVPIALSITASIDEKKFTVLPNEAFSWTHLESGKYNLKIEWPMLALMSDQEKVIEVSAGHYYFVEFGGDFYVSVGVPYTENNIDYVDSENALKTLKKCCRYIPSQL